MRRKHIVVSIIVVLIIILAAIISMKLLGKKPFKELDASSIESAMVYLSPPDATIDIVEVKELVEYLQDVVIYEEDNSYTEYVGQGVTYNLTFRDGSETSITAYNPFIIIDGVGYKCKYEPCEALNALGNRLLNAAK